MLVMLNLGNALGIFFGVLFGIPLLYVLYVLVRTIRIVGKKQAMVVERFGKFHRVCGPGLHLLVPFADKPRVFRWRNILTSKISGGYGGNMQEKVVIKPWSSDYIDLRENIMDFPSQPIITRDNVEITVHPMILYKLIDPMRVVYETYDISHAVEKIVQTTLRAIIGDMGMDDTLASREEINRALKTRVEKNSKELGDVDPSGRVVRNHPHALGPDRHEPAAGGRTYSPRGHCPGRWLPPPDENDSRGELRGR